jgi:hypothetical protein
VLLTDIIYIYLFNRIIEKQQTKNKENTGTAKTI